MEIVAIDIGGTHARFAIAEIDERGVRRLDEPVTLKTADHPNLASAWRAFAQTHGGPLPRAAAIAVASRVGGESIKLTNNDWIIYPARIGAELGVDTFTLINDFGAIAHAVARLGGAHFVSLAGPDAPLPDSGVLTVCGPGTGLGVAQIWRDGTGYRVIETEGGHMDFAPLDTLEDRVLADLRGNLGRVSVERVVAGPGIVAFHRAIAAIEDRAITPSDDRTIWQRALDGQDDLASAALDRFCMSLGAVAGDLALAHGAAGVVIAGGLGLRLRDHLPRSGFAMRFAAKGRFQPMMAAMPVKLITHPQPGLYGAAAAFAQEHAQ